MSARLFVDNLPEGTIRALHGQLLREHRLHVSAARERARVPK